MEWAFFTSSNPFIYIGLNVEDKRESVRKADFLWDETTLWTGAEKGFFCDANEVSSDEDEDNSEEGEFRGCKWDFRIGKEKDQCGKKVWFFEGVSGVEGNFWDKDTWTWANWVGDRYSNVSFTLVWLERRSGFPCSKFLIVLSLVTESEGKKDDSELDEAEKLSFGLADDEVLVFS